MGNNIIAGFVTVATALIGVALLATLVSKNAQTSNVIKSASQGFGYDLGVALSPVSGTNVSQTSFTGGGGGSLNFM